VKKLVVLIVALWATAVPAQTRRIAADINIDKKSAFEIANEGAHVLGLDSTSNIVLASLVVNNDPQRMITLTEGITHGDTLEMRIHHTDPAYHHEVKITIVNRKFWILYSFLTSGPRQKRVINPVFSQLTLNRNDFTKGDWIRGHLEYQAVCTEDCWEKSIKITGNFSALIK
jgi:hypothetical protein